MYNIRATFGTLPRPEFAPHEGMIKAVVPFCGFYKSVFGDRLAREVKQTVKEIEARLSQGDTNIEHLKEPIVMDVRKAIKTWNDCVKSRIEHFTNIKVELHFAEYNFTTDILECWISKHDVEQLMNYINSNKEVKNKLERTIMYLTTFSDRYTMSDFTPLSNDCPSIFYEPILSSVMGDDNIYHLGEAWYDKFDFSA